RSAFAGFDAQKVARFDEQKIQQLRQNESIIRNELKIRSAVNNARQFLKIQQEYGSFSDYIWQFVEGETIQNQWEAMDEVPAITKESKRLSNDLKQRGFKFTGPTIMYAHMQATGLVNDHLVKCYRHEEVKPS